jgi:Indole-3-glycerol phosphate synthase
MTARRLSQAISEGDGISLIVPATDPGSVRMAEAQGAEGVVVEQDLPGLRDATGLPIMWRSDALPADLLALGADACLIPADAVAGDAERLQRRYAEALDLGLECVVEVRDPDELDLALERLDPEIFLLSPRSTGNGDDPLEQVLDLLPDIPAGKLAIADLGVTNRDEIAQLERAGVDAVIVGTENVADLVSATLPDV